MDTDPRLMWINSRLDEQRLAAEREREALAARRNRQATHADSGAHGSRRTWLAAILRRHSPVASA